MEELRDSIIKILLQQVQLLEQEKSPVQCDMIYRKIFALSTALNAIQPGYPERQLLYCPFIITPFQGDYSITGAAVL